MGAEGMPHLDKYQSHRHDAEESSHWRVFEITSRSEAIHDDSQDITASLHHFIHVLSIATKPLIKHIRWDDFAGRPCIVVRTSLNHSLER
jgi:hypothetical protein